MRATFVGTRPFPLEMLTEDECYPFTAMDNIKIINSIRREDPPKTEYEITVAKIRNRQWTIDKWRLLGYKLKKLHIS